MIRFTLDTGALIALERADRRLSALLELAEGPNSILVPAGVLAQAWRDRPRNAFVARLIARHETAVVPLDIDDAKAAGALMGRAGTSDVVDASVVVCALRAGTPVITSDLDDIAALSATLHVVSL